jgi:secondary thiamine-phosphate synthase enzyme
METLRIRTNRRTQFLDITDAVQKSVARSGVTAGICYLYVPHTTAGITINEHADPDVASDAEAALDRLIPASGAYRHSEGNSDSHIKAILVGSSQFVFVEASRLALGRWQGIFFCEFDGPRERQVHIRVASE